MVQSSSLDHNFGVKYKTNQSSTEDSVIKSKVARTTRPRTRSRSNSREPERSEVLPRRRKSGVDHTAQDLQVPNGLTSTKGKSLVSGRRASKSSVHRKSSVDSTGHSFEGSEASEKSFAVDHFTSSGGAGEGPSRRESRFSSSSTVSSVVSGESRKRTYSGASAHSRTSTSSKPDTTTQKKKLKELLDPEVEIPTRALRSNSSVTLLEGLPAPRRRSRSGSKYKSPTSQTAGESIAQSANRASQQTEKRKGHKLTKSEDTTEHLVGNTNANPEPTKQSKTKTKQKRSKLQKKESLPEKGILPKKRAKLASSSKNNKNTSEEQRKKKSSKSEPPKLESLRRSQRTKNTGSCASSK